MVDVQDGDAHSHKRTAIPQLLNPVSSSSTKRQEGHAYATYRGSLQHPSPSTAARSDLTRSDSSPSGQQAYHLRAAQWGPTDSPPLSNVHCTSSPETNGGVRERSASYSRYESGPRSNDGNGYIVTASFTQSICHPQSTNGFPNPPPHPMPPQLFVCHGGGPGKYSDNFELNCHSLIVQRV